MSQASTTTLKQALTDRILILDGAMGTAIQAKDLSADDYGGPQYEGCNEYLSIARPGVISEIHEGYLKAGCDVIETNSFGGAPVVLAEYGLGSMALEINRASAGLARQLADRYSTDARPRFVAGAMGPTTKAISVTGGITFEELSQNFHTQTKGLCEGGVDYLLLETCQDTRNVKAAIIGIERLFQETGKRLPLAVSCTVEPSGTMLAGQSVEAFLTSLSHIELLYIGLNCATGPEFMTDHLRALSKLSPFPIACVPNAGLPDESGCYLETPEMIANVIARFAQNGWINLAGGCCGTREEHIAKLAGTLRGVKPRVPVTTMKSCLSGIDYLEVTEENRPVIVGERTNVIGSKKFKTLIREGKFDEASEVARAQIKGGAQVIDICLADPDGDEYEDTGKFLSRAIGKLRTPIMIDSTDPRTIELALTFCQGKSIINSVNLEDGEKRFSEVIPLAKPYGAALVVGTIDDDPTQGMGISRQRKLEIARKAYALLTGKYGVKPEDIYWDALVFPCASGDKNYEGSAAETIAALTLLKDTFPGTKTVLGISNVSFGLPPSGREVLNSVFLYHCVQAGLDLAIVNAEKLARFATIPENERILSENLLFNRVTDAATTFADFFRDRKVAKSMTRSALPLNERLKHLVVEGSKDGLAEDLDEALETTGALEIINGPLMSGMDEVGRLFNSNQLIVAEVLQSAEVMKAAVAYLEPHMETTNASSRGKVLLATVKGDVHDIGKNLVEIILSNNGFTVVDLGIKVPPEQLVAAVKEHKPDVIGVSGLLVKSAHQMVATAEDLAKAGIGTPILVGGAALSEKFTDHNIAKAYSTGTVAYARDAMSGLELARAIVDPEKFEKIKSDLALRRSQPKDATVSARTAPVESKRSKSVEILATVPEAPDLKRHVLRNTPIEQIWRYVNPLMLYGRHLGIPGSAVRLLEGNPSQAPKNALEIFGAVEEVKTEFKGTEIMQPSAVFQFFKAAADGNKLIIFNGNAPTVLDFPRQNKPGNNEDGLCLSDYTLPLGQDGEVPAGPETGKDKQDTIAIFVVSVGKGIRQLAGSLKARGEYLKSHIVQALALESAEAYAELIHSQIRKAWGFPDPPEMTMLERFQAKYRGKRYSFGYPACPRLDDQKIIWKLLDPTEIGVELTDGYMMDPESSVSAIVFHHPQATYFSVGNLGGNLGGSLGGTMGSEAMSDNRT